MVPSQDIPSQGPEIPFPSWGGGMLKAFVYPGAAPPSHTKSFPFGKVKFIPKGSLCSR